MDANRPKPRSPLFPATIALTLLVATACTTPASPVLGRAAPLPMSVAASPPQAQHAAGWVAYHRPAGPPISLTASDGTGLALHELDAKAVIEEPLAFTDAAPGLRNPEGRTLEGTFSITLPPGAAISRFAMRTPDGWQEGEVVEKKAARAAYEDFLHRKQDPALLEQAAGNQFSARVFPIPARGQKELVVSYSQELTAATPYVVPLQGLPSVQALHVEASRDGESMGRFERTAFVPDRDFELDPAQLHDGPGLRSGNLVVVRVAPVVDAPPDPLTSAVFLVDTSASRALGFDAELSLVEGLVHGVTAASPREAKVAVVAFDQTADVIFEGGAESFGARELSALRERGALGASDLGGALTKAGTLAQALGARRVVLISDGVATAFETTVDKLGGTARLPPGARRGQARCRRGRGHPRRRDAEAPRHVGARPGRRGARRRQTTWRRCSGGSTWRRGRGLPVHVDGARFAFPKASRRRAAGGRGAGLCGARRRVALRLSVGGVQVEDGDRSRPPPRPLLARALAQAKIANLLDASRRGEGPSSTEKDIVALSTQYRVLSPYTSMLVLETEADYDRFHIDRRSLSDILTVDEGRLAVRQRVASPLVGAKELPTAKATPASPPADLRRFAAGSTSRSADQPAADLPPPEATAEGYEAQAPAASAMPAAPPSPVAQAAAGPMAADFASGGLALSGAGEGGGGNVMTLGHGAGGGMGRLAGAQAAQAPAARPGAPVATGTAPAHRLARRPDAPRLEKPASGDPYLGNLKVVMDALAHGDRGRALAEASRWHRESPGDVLSVVALGEAVEAAGDVARASRVYGSILDLFPARADLRRFAGARLERLRSEAALALAEDSYEKAEAERPDHPSSHRLLAFARLRQGRYADAFEAARVGAARAYPPGALSRRRPDTARGPRPDRRRMDQGGADEARAHPLGAARGRRQGGGCAVDPVRAELGDRRERRRLPHLRRPGRACLLLAEAPRERRRPLRRHHDRVRPRVLHDSPAEGAARREVHAPGQLLLAWADGLRDG